MTIAATTVNRTDITTSVDTADVSPPAAAANASSGVLLAEPATLGLGDGSMAALAMLLTRADEQDRKSARQVEDAADSAAMKAENDRVAQMRAKADAEESAAIATGVGGMIAGGLSVVGAFAGTSTTTGKDGAIHTVDWAQRGAGAGKLADSIGEIFAGLNHCEAGHADAAAASADASAQSDIRIYNRAHDTEAAANSSMQRVEQFLDQVQQTKNAAVLTTATFRA